jgi:hypothetical protein
METGLEGLVRKESNRREQARKAVEDHESAHITVTVGIPAKANTDSEGNANGIPGRRRTALGA